MKVYECTVRLAETPLSFIYTYSKSGLSIWVGDGTQRFDELATSYPGAFDTDQSKCVSTELMGEADGFSRPASEALSLKLKIPVHMSLNVGKLHEMPALLMLIQKQIASDYATHVKPE